MSRTACLTKAKRARVVTALRAMAVEYRAAAKWEEEPESLGSPLKCPLCLAMGVNTGLDCQGCPGSATISGEITTCLDHPVYGRIVYDGSPAALRHAARWFVRRAREIEREGG